MAATENNARNRSTNRLAKAALWGAPLIAAFYGVHALTQQAQILTVIPSDNPNQVLGDVEEMQIPITDLIPTGAKTQDGAVEYRERKSGKSFTSAPRLMNSYTAYMGLANNMGENCVPNSLDLPIDLPVKPSPQPSKDERSPANIDASNASTQAQPNLSESRNFFSATSSIAQEAKGIELLEAAIDRRKSIAEAAKYDQKKVSTPYTSLSIEKLGEYFKRAEVNIAQNVKTLENAVDGLEGERPRFTNLYQNALGKVEAAQEILAEQQQNQQLAAVLPFENLLNPSAGDNPLARTKALADIFSGLDGTNTANTNDALIDRMLMFSGLPKEEQGRIFASLRLAENRELKLKDGTRAQLPVLHNGYIFGAGSSSMDCSSFVSSILPDEARKGQFTTLDFRAMYDYLKTGRMPTPPQWKEDRAKLVRSAARSFVGLNLYAGERLQVGDLLVYRLPWMLAGHVFVIRKYDPKTQTAVVIDAAQSAGTVREREFRLSVSPAGAAIQHLRPGLFGLRLKTSDTTVCRYADASGKRGGGGAL